MIENSFFGIGAFGVYQATLVPCKAPPNVRTDDASDIAPLASGKWAVPEHWTVCRDYQLFHLGLFHKEAANLRAQFVNAFSNVNGNMPRPIGPPQEQEGVSTFADNSQAFAERVEEPRASGSTAVPVHVETRADDGMAYIGTGVDYSAKEGAGPFDGDQGNAPASMTIRTSSSAPQIHGHVRHVRDDPNGPTRVEGVSEKELTTESVAMGAAELGLDVTKPGAMSSGMGIHAPVFQSTVDEMLREVPVSVVESLEGAVGEDAANRAGNVGFASTEGPAIGYGPSEKDDKICTMGVIEGMAETKITGNGSPSQKANITTGGSSSTKEDEKVGVGQNAKKTLPAPTKSEIVIRNRISAQRSNEKRRRKIEATKSELTYLKATYLPQLEHKRGSLLSENQTLRLQFMQKYHEGEITSFF